MAPRIPALIALILVLAGAGAARAQVDGSVSVMVDTLPASDAGEVRTRLFVERTGDISGAVRIRLSGYVDALLARREGSAARDAIVRPQDLYVEFHGERFDLRVGSSRIAWGRLDEFQPTDVVNPTDLSRFLLEGRAEARLPVGLARGRLFLPGGIVVEGIAVPFFRAGVYDQLDEATSPFNLDPPVQSLIPIFTRKPAATWRNIQGGARVTASLGRVDVGGAVYRGFRPFPVAGFESSAAVGAGFEPNTDAGAGFSGPAIVKRFPRFTMIGADFETVRGEWGVRGEAAAFIEDDEFQGGVGVDRRAGGYRLAGNVLWTHGEEDDVSLVAAADRSFARETRTLRVFAVYNPADATTFVRGILATSLRDNVSLEGSAGIFAGRSEAAGTGGGSRPIIGLLADRDFAYLRLKVFF